MMQCSKRFVMATQRCSVSAQRLLLCAAVLLPLAFAGCKSDPLGSACAEDADCGPGFDCYRDMCVQVCTSDKECRGDDVLCTRHRCLSEDGSLPFEPKGQTTAAASGKRSPTRSSARAGSKKTPPVPDVAAAELRAIRRELGRVRRQQAQILKLLREAHPQLATDSPAKAAGEQQRAGKTTQ